MATILRTIARTFARTVAAPVAPAALAPFAIGRHNPVPSVSAAEQAVGRHVASRMAATADARRLCSETGRHQYGCQHRPAVAPWDAVPLTIAETVAARQTRRRSAAAALSR
jgi:hypothetical protein